MSAHSKLRLAIINQGGVRLSIYSLNDLVKEVVSSRVTEVMCGSVSSIGRCAEQYAVDHNTRLTVISPLVPGIERVQDITDCADLVLVLAKGESSEFQGVIEQVYKASKPTYVKYVQ